MRRARCVRCRRPLAVGRWARCGPAALSPLWQGPWHQRFACILLRAWREHAKHNDVRDNVFDLARLADTTAEKEVLGLLDTAPGLRPADILTSAVSPGRVSALDVGVAAPGARHAGADCTESMRRRKRAVYARYLDALAAEGVDYQPLTWSCWGREHPDTTAVLTQLARRAARRRGVASHAPLLRRARAGIGAALARRAAAMLRACLPAGAA